MPRKLGGKCILILPTHDVEQSELEEAGATVDVVSLEKGEIKGWDKKDWGAPRESWQAAQRCESERP